MNAHIYRVFFFTGPPPKKSKYGKPRLGNRLSVSRMSKIHLTSSNLGFPYFNLLGGGPVKKTPCMFHHIIHINRMKIKGKDKRYSEKSNSTEARLMIK